MPSHTEYQQLGPSSNFCPSSKWLLTELLGGSLAAVYTLILNLIAVNIIFADHFTNHIALGAQGALLGTAISIAAWLPTTKLPVLTNADTFMASLVVQSAASIRQRGLRGPRHTNGLHTDASSAIGTLSAVLGLTTASTGLIYYLLGVARMGIFAQFVPSPVMAGYLASIGYVMLHSAVEMVAPQSRPGSGGWMAFTAPQANPALVIAILLGAAIFSIQRLRPAYTPVIVPACILLSTAAFHAVRLTAFTDAAEQADLLERWTLSFSRPQAAEDAGPLAFFSSLQIAEADWRFAVSETVEVLAASILPNAVGRLLTFSALEQRFDVDVDYNSELRAIGYSSLAATPAILTPSLSLTPMIIAKDVGATRLPPYVVILSSLLFAATGVSYASHIPTFMFSAILCSSAFGYIITQLLHAWHSLTRLEFALVVVHIGLTATLGMVFAVVLGVILTALTFVFEYTRHSGVLQSATLESEQSRVRRPPAERRMLDESGASCLILHMVHAAVSNP